LCQQLLVYLFWVLYEAIIIAQWTQWSPDYKMWNHSISICTGRYQQQSFWIYGLLSSLAEVSGLLKYQLHIKGIVLYYWGSLRSVKSWIVIYYRGLKLPHTAVVLLVLESDGACTSLNRHCARKSAVLVLVWCYKATCDREQDLWRYWLPAGYNKQWCDRASGCGCSSNKCLKVEQWSSDLAVSCTLAKHCDIQSENARFETLSLSPLTTIHIDRSRQLCASFTVSLRLVYYCLLLVEWLIYLNSSNVYFWSR